MKRSVRVPPVPAEALAELDEFLRPRRVEFRRRKSEQAAARYLHGLLSEQPNKNCETLALLMPEGSRQPPPESTQTEQHKSLGFRLEWMPANYVPA